MGTQKKEANRKVREGKSNDGMGNVKTKGENFYRSAKRVRHLNMYKDGKPQRNAAGDITKDAVFQSRDVPSARIEPNRKWFGNTRVISQESLTAFRTAMAEKASDPYQVLLKTNKLPLSLIREVPNSTNGVKHHHAKMMIETSSFADTFGPKAQRKRVKVNVGSLMDMAEDVDKSMDKYAEKQEQARLLSGRGEGQDEDDMDAPLTMAIEHSFSKGTSRRIFNELYRVMDSSDVLLMVLDARDPLGTRCYSVEKYLRQEAPHKHLIFILNKCDLAPTSVVARWVRKLSKERPTLAMHSSLTNPFGKGSLIELLRQYAKLHSDRKQISVGLIGYPNVGKSSVVNTLKSKKVANVAPIPGETKVWQYITLTKKIYLIDCPGIVPPNQNDTPQDLVLRGTVRVENVENPEQYIDGMLKRVKQHHLERTYLMKGWNNHVEFLEMIARKSGKLLKGGEPDLDGVAKTVLNDFVRGKIPHFIPPPEEEGATDEKIEGRSGRLGEMPKKRKAEDASAAASTADPAEAAEAADDSDEFEGFGSEAEGDEDAISMGSVSDGDLDSEAEDSDDGASSKATTSKTSVPSRSGSVSEKSATAGSKRRRKA
ncbi:NGP1NT domain-containing protein [Plectosphaerella cucumerina]|uniref:Nucleolar GTP-binding protein 2 n=1 Tax=Plectosphaerella cucumerina TaxID=40658 RepID=A0A8K0T668_9PEZI|nr:NGP1NT domain-containing protein [Plectosphaerella cucumerina]